MVCRITNWANNHKVLSSLFMINMVSFCAVRSYWYASGQFGAKMEVLKPAGDDEVMYYLVAGCVNQPASAFGFLVDQLDGGVTYVNYQAMRGCSMKTIANQVIADARKHSYQPRVVGISIGDYVARRTEDEVPGTKSVGINPEPVASILRPWAQIATKVGSIVVEALTVPMGWISAIPWYNGCGNRFSTAFIADQFRDIGFMSSTPHATTETQGVIISERPGKAKGDEFLDNAAIERYFDGIPVAIARANHGHTIDAAEEYLAAWQELEFR